jgi:hypothetical protein
LRRTLRDTLSSPWLPSEGAVATTVRQRFVNEQTASGTFRWRFALDNVLAEAADESTSAEPVKLRFFTQPQDEEEKAELQPSFAPLQVSMRAA